MWAQTTIIVAGGTDPGTASNGTTQPGSLSAAIAEVNAGGGNGPPYTIQITGNVTLNGPPSPIFNSVTIVGNGNTTNDTAHLHDRRRRGDADDRPRKPADDQFDPRPAPAGGDQRADASSRAWASPGGAGGAGAGGGLGAGGALFVNQSADVTLTDVNFTGNQARGGNGGTGKVNLLGGGGGLGGNGGLYGPRGSGGGGIFGSATKSSPFGQPGGGGGLFGNGLSIAGGAIAAMVRTVPAICRFRA